MKLFSGNRYKRAREVEYGLGIIGVERRMYWQDKVVVAACVIAIVAVFSLLFFGVVQR